MRFVICVGVLLGLSTSTLGKDIAEIRDADGKLYERLHDESASCGPNALYVYLKLYGINVKYDDLVKFVPRNKVGTSLQQMAQTSGHFGLESQAIYIDWDKVSLEKLQFPIIAHSARGSKETEGHYHVLLSNDGKNITYIDGTTGAYYVTPWAWFRNTSLTGFCIVAQRVSIWSQFATEIGCLSVLFLLWRARTRFGVRVRLAAACGILVCVGREGHCEDGSKAIIPCGEHAISLMRIAYGNLDSVSRAQANGSTTDGLSNDCSLFGISTRARAAGIPLSLRQVTPSQMQELPTPFITSLEGSRSDAQALCVVHYVGADFVDFIYEQPLVLKRMSKSDFLREWSGCVAIVPPSRSPAVRTSGWFMIAGVFAGAVVPPLGIRCLGHFGRRGRT